MATKDHNYARTAETTLAVFGANITFASGYSASDAPKGQSPKVILHGCSDSREPAHMLGSAQNFLFDANTAGAMVSHPMLSASGTYAARHIKDTNSIWVVGHTGCGLIKAAVGDSLGAYPDISQEPLDLQLYVHHARKHLKPFEPVIKEGLLRHDPQGLDEHVLHALASEILVDEQVAYLCELHQDLVSSGKLTVFGGMFGFHGLYEGKAGMVRPINVNGEKRAEKIRQHPAFSMVAKHSKFTPERLTQAYNRNDYTTKSFVQEFTSAVQDKVKQ